MKRFAILLVLLLLTGCSSQTPKPSEEHPKTQEPKVSEEAAVNAAKSADPRAGVEGWATWQVRLAEDMMLEVGGKTEKRTVWVVEATHKDGEKLVIYVTADEYPPKVLRVDKTPAQPQVSEEAAVKAAQSADPQSQVEGWAGWQVRFEGAVEIEVNGKTEKHSAWVVEAVHFDGEKLVFYVRADEYPPKMLRIDKTPGKYVSKEKAVQAALQGTQNVEVKSARLVEKHRLDLPTEGAKELPVWLIDLISKSDQRPAGKVIVDALTGKVLSVSSPPSGQ